MIIKSRIKRERCFIFKLMDYLPLEILQGYPFRFGHQQPNVEQLKYHHHSEEGKDDATSKFLRKKWKGVGDHSRKNPMGKATPRHSGCSDSIGKYFRDEDPNHRTLTDGMRGDKRENKQWHAAERLIKKGKRNEGE